MMDLHSGLGEQVTYLDSGTNPDPATIVRAGHLGKYSWSRDGSRLAFPSQVAEPSTEDEAEHEVPAAGNGPRPLVLTARTPPDWTLVGIFGASKLRSPWDIRENGNPQTATFPHRKISQLFLVNVNTRILQQLTFDNNGYFNPDWSPKGDFIACASSEGKSLAGFPDIPTNIYLVDVGGQKSTALTSGSGDKYYPSWSPDGDWVAYKGGKHFGKESIFVIARTGGLPV